MTASADHEISSIVSEFLDRRREPIVAEWSASQFFAGGGGDREQAAIDCAEVLTGVRRAVVAGDADNPAADGFAGIRTLLEVLTAQQSDDSRLVVDTAASIRSLRDPLLRLWHEENLADGAVVPGAILLGAAVDTLGLVLLDVALSAGRDTIASQREQLAELSTPVIKLWDGVLAIPLIGTLDSMRSQVATESLLQAILDQQARVAILDITGVPTVDTMVAQHLLKTAQAARLMGAECVISGIRPQIAHTMVQLGIDLEEVVTRAKLADAFTYALGKLGLSVVGTGPGDL
ncbi:STAS domain-containing protein [Amycolatopsis sp. K13G38]|uniref:STAS domain-containing protein n=1 Tax=Amycolatopsis acididurans TaxID=2724524 RepID=A0ABX1IXA7_9PSEU|nr:STAS domain-containing protein [Amycolatopsis acididurans]NKQ52084.1 STAS domain-containing protein [Amycolatopsis acididurans]